jgi:hypothetical protein
VGVVTLGGVPFLHNFPGPGNNNTFLGTNAGNTSASLTGFKNTAVGDSALFAITTGSQNAAFGAFALENNTTANNNSAFGANALNANTTGSGGNSAFGSFALFANTTGASNAAFGAFALDNNTTGLGNSAFGSSALNANTTANGNSAFGSDALQSNTTGADNSAFGIDALFANTTGLNNSAFGIGALGANTTANFNAAFGDGTLQANTVGASNVAFGHNSLHSLTSGDSNIAIGGSAGSTLMTGSNNIYVGNSGVVSSESNTIRIGDPAVQTATFMAGVSGATSAGGVAVLVNSSGQLGTSTSSRRFKDDIADMGTESDLLMKLRPVSFYYKSELDPTRTRQYGLVAEEVAQVSPELVVFDKNGVPQTVRYHFVNAMLLNEVQKQQSTIARQQTEIQDLSARLARLEALMPPAP